MIWGNEAMLQLQELPLIRHLARMHYEGSIDKQGGNSDWDWSLYQDERGEWVLLDVMGPGCVYNMVQHRYITSPEAVFRFYLDGEENPRYEISPAQFGEKYPFVGLLADRYIGPVEPGQPYTPIRVVRGYVPIPFEKRIKVTSSVRLEGNGEGGGGWGHILYHTYPEGTNLRSFRPEDSCYELNQLWKQNGHSVIACQKAEQVVQPAFDLEVGETREIYHDSQAGLVVRLRLTLHNFDRVHLEKLWIRACWDGHERPDLELPLGCLFGNELGFHSVSYLFTGMSTDGEFYCCFPMPYLRSASLQLINRGEGKVRVDCCRVEFTREYNALYAQNDFGYFRASPYYSRRHTEGSDSVIAQIHGSGHVVGAVITGFGAEIDGRADCEGDVRVYIDGCRTPQIESDGSESYASYGWGFATPPEGHPVGGYDGELPLVHKNWSMTRLCIGDCYPFFESVRFGIESGWNNDWYMEHSGAVFYYGRDGKCMDLLDSVETEETELEAYFEGDEDDTAVRLKGCYGQAISLRVEIPENARGLLLRRVSDQRLPRQMAEVLVDGHACQRKWYFADSNPYKRWLEDEYVLTIRELGGPGTHLIELRPTTTPWENPWNLFGMKVFALY